MKWVTGAARARFLAAFGRSKAVPPEAGAFMTSVTPSQPWHCKTAWTSRPSAVCWATTRRGSRWTPTPTSPPTPNSKPPRRWAISYPVLSDAFRYPLPLGSAFGSEKSSGRKQQLMQTKRPETLRFRVFLAHHEGFEPPAFWSVGCLTGKSESFRLRFVLFATVRSADFPLFPSSPARFFRILGQKWVKRGAPAPTPTAPRSPSRRRRQPDRPRRPRRWRSPAEYR